MLKSRLVRKKRLLQGRHADKAANAKYGGMFFLYIIS
jgi:hypothetical protein